MDRCKEGVMRGFHMYQCSRKAKKDGYCFQHHPEAKKKREEASRVAYEKKMEQSPLRRLVKANKEIEKWREIAISLGYVPKDDE